MRTKRTPFLAMCTACLLAVFVSTPATTTASHTPAHSFAGWFYVEVEATLYRKGIEISSDNPSERRWYFSNVVVMPDDVPSYSLAKKKIVPAQNTPNRMCRSLRRMSTGSMGVSPLNVKKESAN